MREINKRNKSIMLFANSAASFVIMLTSTFVTLVILVLVATFPGGIAVHYDPNPRKKSTFVIVASALLAATFVNPMPAS